MSYARTVTISCNGQGCKRTVCVVSTAERPVVMVVVARDTAGHRGWIHEGEVDLCPVHSHMRV